MNDPSARMQVRGIGDLMHPGACAVCGNGNNTNGYVDIGVYYEYEGQVYLCMLCAEEFVATIGGATADELLVTAELTSRSLEENEQLKSEVEKLNGELEQYRNLMRIARDDAGNDNDSDLPIIEDPKSEPGSIEPVSEVTEPVVGSPGVPEPVLNEPIKNDGHSVPDKPKRGNGSTSKRTATINL